MRGATRLLRTADGAMALSLARPADLDCVPALVQQQLVAEPWPTVAAWAARTSTATAVERA